MPLPSFTSHFPSPQLPPSDCIPEINEDLHHSTHTLIPNFTSISAFDYDSDSLVDPGPHYDLESDTELVYCSEDEFDSGPDIHDSMASYSVSSVSPTA